MKILKTGKRIAIDTRGVAIIEFVLLLPLFALLLCGVIEFGWYFVRSETLARALTVTSADIQSFPSATTQTVANTTGTGLIPFGTGGNYICAQAYQTFAHASAAPNCTSGTWALGVANPTCSDTSVACTVPYYVNITAYAAPKSLTGFANEILPGFGSITQAIPAVTAGGGGSNLPTCAPGQYITSTGASLTCVNGNTLSGAVGGGCNSDGTGGWGVATNPQGFCSGVCPSGYTKQTTNAEQGEMPDYITYLCIHN